jgi:diguanylate cyclase (GGDEF)-like protein
VDSEVKTRITQAHVVEPRGQAGLDYLVVIYSTGRSVRLGSRWTLEKGHVSIGRGSENAIVLESDSVSRRHARIEKRANKWWACDLNSTNGTYVNHQQVKESPLNNGDLVKVGDTIFKYLTGTDVEAQYHEEIYRMTIVDGLTNAFNKRYLVEVLDRELARARRYDRPLSILILDIDHFKQINDRFGHLAGDHVLKELGHAIAGRIRSEETFARYGGEEFVLVLPETPRTGAVELAEQVRLKVEKQPFEFEAEKIPVTVSIGVATLEGRQLDSQTFLKIADDNLYKAKRGGRNRVVS